MKAWKGAHGYCYVTFTEHTGPIIDVKFNSTNALFSASVDGTIRAWDMIRYATPLQSPRSALTSLAHQVRHNQSEVGSIS